MAGRRTLHSTLVAALGADTVSGLAPSSGVQLPPPRAYVTTWSLWFVLGLVSGISPVAERLAGQLSVLVLLTKLVIGPAGGRIVAGLDHIANLYPTPNPAAATNVAPSTATV